MPGQTSGRMPNCWRNQPSGMGVLNLTPSVTYSAKIEFHKGAKFSLALTQREPNYFLYGHNWFVLAKGEEVYGPIPLTLNTPLDTSTNILSLFVFIFMWETSCRSPRDSASMPSNGILKKAVDNISPYLYACTVEYSLICSGSQASYMLQLTMLYVISSATFRYICG